MSITKWIKNNTYSLKGKNIVITGSTGGLGKEICKVLVSLDAKLILVDRNIEKSTAHKKEILSVYPKAEVTLVTADMADFNSVREAVSILLGMQVDILILNAGAYSIPRKICETGYDNVFQINYISQYYMARTLLPLIKERNGKLVAVGSIAHNYSHTDINDIDFHTRDKSSLVYGNSKRYLMWSLYALRTREKVSFAITHPGITFTNITAHYPPLIFAIIKNPMKVIFMKPRMACLAVIQGVFVPCSENEWFGPKLFDIWGFPKKKMLKTVKQDEYFFISETADKIYDKLAIDNT